MKDTAAASKYAKALFKEAKTQNQILACQQGLTETVRVARLRRSLVQILAHPFISPEEKNRMVHSLLGEYATPLLERFLSLLIARRRFPLLFLIAQQFQEEVDLEQNVEAIRVRSAMPMPEAQQKQLKAQLEKWLGATVRMDVQIDPQLIGGVVIQTRDRVLDQSLSGKLQELQHQLTV